MNDGKNSFILYHDRYDMIKVLTDEDAGQLIKAIFEYEVNKTIPEFSSKVVNFAFNEIKKDLDKDRKKIKQKKTYATKKEEFFAEILNPEIRWANRHYMNFYAVKDYINHITKEDVYSYVSKMNYDDFLNTPYWKAIASYAKHEAHNRCSFCGESENLEVHHISYKNKGLELWSRNDLIVLCDNCHRSEHG